MKTKKENPPIKSTVQKFIESLTPQERKQFDEEYKEFLLSEFDLALADHDEKSARQLAKMAGVSLAAYRNSKK